MVGLDTNIIVRYIMQDDERQAAIANRIVGEEISLSNKGFVSSVVLCEAVWVLARFYKLNRESILNTVLALLRTKTLEFEHRECVIQAHRDSDSGSASFADCLIGLVSRKCGTSTTLTFDRDASRLEYFRLAQ